MADMIPAWVEGKLTPVDKLQAHLLGLRHKAVSVFILAIAPEGSEPSRLLIQRRAAGKYHTPGLWANSCCTHPHWSETDADCAERRLHEELGLTDIPLRPAGRVEYRAGVGNGMVEHEVVAMFRGTLPAPVPCTPDPAEVSATRWLSLPELHREMAEKPESFTPWFRIYLSDHAGLIFPEA